MSYNILGINPFHNGSACVLADGELIYFLEEERLSRRKHDANPFRTILDILNRFKINEIALAGINTSNITLGYTEEDPFIALIRKFYPKIPYTSFSPYHHLTHLTQTYNNSGFKNSVGIVIDSGGSISSNQGLEMDSIFLCSPTQTTLLYRFNSPLNPSPSTKVEMNIGASYSTITQYLGFKLNEEGKTMGLSSYGNLSLNTPSLFKKNISNVNYLYEQNTEGTRSFIVNLPPLNITSNVYSQKEKDLAWKLQQDTQQIVGDYVEKYTKQTGQKQVCCAGGYFLNCVANYYLIKRFPNIEFYFEPISHDGGTAIGAAKMLWHQKTQDTTIRPQKTLYYGPKYSKKKLLKGIKKYT